MSWNKYPYTDFHELNLDWVISTIKELSARLEAVKEEATEAATENAIQYVDEHLADIENDFATLQNNFDILEAGYTEVSNLVNQFITNFSADLASLRTYIDDGLHAQTMQTTLMIQQNNDYILGELEQFLSEIKVINYFTGEKVSIQDMFNYLAMLHLNDSIDYNEMATRALTYTYVAGLSLTYTNLAMHGNTLYI